MQEQKARAVADEILGLYETYGNQDYIGEPVSQIEHMCQCARLAQIGGYGDEVVLAAFFHDIGHLLEHVTAVDHMGEFGIVDHEKIGADYLRAKGFSEKIARLVGSHVDAKRYLTYKYPEYYDMLSPASKSTLEYQGGRMSPEEAEGFESDEWFTLYLTLRKWDELAKQPHIALPSLDNFRELMISHLSQNN